MFNIMGLTILYITPYRSACLLHRRAVRAYRIYGIGAVLATLARHIIIILRYALRHGYKHTLAIRRIIANVFAICIQDKQIGDLGACQRVFNHERNAENLLDWGFRGVPTIL